MRKFHIDGKEVQIDAVSLKGDTISVIYEGKTYEFFAAADADGQFILTDKGMMLKGMASEPDHRGEMQVFIDGKSAFVSAASGRKNVEMENRANVICSPMPGKVIALHVKEGDAVVKGAPLVTLEAMKLQHTLTAPYQTTVKKLGCSADMQVKEGSVLVELEESGSV